MTPFGEKLKEIREDLGQKSARAFYQMLARTSELNFNYQYYVKIESGKTLPSPAVSDLLAALLGGDHGDQLTLAYCKTLFPKREHLFRPSTLVKPTKANIPVKNQYTVRESKVLTEAQIAVVCKSQVHYFLFLILTLATNPVSTDTLKTYFKGKNIQSALADLRDKKLCRETATGWISTSSEHKFPSAETESLKKFYAIMDPWDRELDQFFDFNQEYYKFLFRKVSPRHLGIAMNHCRLLTDVLLSSEEVDPALNTETVFFELKLSKGSLPG